VALVFPDPTDPFFSLVLEGVLSALGDEFRLNLFAPRTAEDYGPDTVQRAMAGDLAGLIVGRPGPAILDGLTPSCPVVVLDAGGRYDDVTSIDPDIGSAVADLADHLVGLGHRRVAYAGVQRTDGTPLPRRAALRAELNRRGADLVGPDVLVPRLSMAEAQRAFAAQWPALDRLGVTAVVCGDDVLAYGLLAAAEAGGIDIPGRLSVAAMFGLPYSATVSPPLTTIDVAARELGIRGVAALRAQVDGRTRPFSGTVPASLVIRRSTAAPA
jgi:DNA-binding LacI/PurR family transcriptional regulator